MRHNRRRGTASVSTRRDIEVLAGALVAVAGVIIAYIKWLHRVVRNHDEIRLTPKEFDLLAFLAHNPDRVLTHRAILKAIWGPHAVNEPEHLWVLIGQLRKKIEPDPAKPRYLISEPWVGYRFAIDAAE